MRKPTAEGGAPAPPTIMCFRSFIFALTVLAIGGLGFQISARRDANTGNKSEPELRTASNHPMQYYVSLPDGWNPKKTWPVMVVIDGSSKEFLDLARLYADARKGRPFIIISPIVLTNGGTDLRKLSAYHYSDAVWDEVDRTGRCKFDLDGLVAVIGDVRQRFGGEAKVYISGFSAGGHAMWAMIFQNPELLAAAAPASANYIGRCVEDSAISKAPERINLPIRGFEGDSGRSLEAQFKVAREVAERHGYQNISYRVVAGEHDPHAAAILDYFFSLYSAGSH